MRVTIWLLLEHVHVDDIAFLIESYIRPEMNTNTKTGEWYPSLTSGHMEHLQDCLTERKHLDMLMRQACAISDLGMINRLITLGEKDWNAGFISAKSFNQVKAARIMITNGADVNYESPLGHTYDRVGGSLDDLHSADLLPMYELLLNNGFRDLNELVTQTVMSDSVGLFNLVKNRIAHIAVGELIANAIIHNSINLVKNWINICGEENRRDISSLMIQCAVLDQSIEVTKYLLTEGADPNNAISHACRLNQKKVMCVLFAAGATCGCGKSRDAHIDEYTKSDSDEIEPNRARGLKRNHEDEGDD